VFTWLVGIKNTIIAGSVCLIVGYMGGWFTANNVYKGRVARQAIAQLNETRKDDAHAVADSQAKSDAVEDRVADIEVFQEKVQTEAQRHVEKSVPTRVAPFRVEGQGLSAPYQYESLTYGLVCVLNAARDNREANCPAPGSDAASRTVTEATFAVFVANDLKVVEMYHELAFRHDSLVDYVLGLQAEQRTRMGILETSVSSDVTGSR
jgi:hypothetical protein